LGVFRASGIAANFDLPVSGVDVLDFADNVIRPAAENRRAVQVAQFMAPGEYDYR
jgi:hypothetical protein